MNAPEFPAGDITQRTILEFLLNPLSYSHRPERVRLLQTHSSWVFIAGAFVYKVKKPVNFGFLDFSTLEKRNHFCQREIELNRRLSHDVYLGVVPISKKGGQIIIGPGDEIAEYAVQMRRLPSRYFMLRLLEQSKIGPPEIDRIVSTLQRFYVAQRPRAEISAWGRISKLKISTDENFRQTADFIGQTISRPAYEAVCSYTSGFYRKNAPLFSERVRKRHILDCHGDLHMDHIHIEPERLTIYDCIEFNDRFRHIDVASDVAFLAMDLDFHRRPDLSRYFSTEMSVVLDDSGMLRLLDFYKCYRAYVRGKVESFQQAAPGLPDGERRKIRALARRYFRLALRYAVSGSRPMVIAVMGRVASGKSTLARSLSEELGWKFFSSDRIRKELACVPLYVRGDEMERRQMYTKSMTDKTYEALERHATDQLGQHRGVILDATFGHRRRRAEICKVLDGMGVDYCFIESRASVTTMKRRLAARARSAHEISDARLEDYAKLDQGYEPPDELPRPHLVVVKTARTIEAVLASTLKALAQRRVRHPQSLEAVR